MKDDITCVFEGVAGVGGIYISNIKAAQNIQILHQLGIKAVVTVVKNGNVSHSKQDITDHLYVPAYDAENYDLSKHFDCTYDFIDNVRKRTNVLVHCHAGISRSATIVIAYLLKKYNYSLENVIAMVKRRRNKINPNKGFLQQLKQEAIKMKIPGSQNQLILEDILKNKSRKISKDVRRPLSSYKSNYGDSTKNVQLNLRNSITKQVEQNNTRQDSNKRDQKNVNNIDVNNIIGLNTKIQNKTKQQQLKIPRQINQNQWSRKSMSKTLQKYKEPTSSDFQELSNKVQRFKSKILELQRKKSINKKIQDINRSNNTCSKIFPNNNKLISNKRLSSMQMQNYEQLHTLIQDKINIRQSNPERTKQL